MASPNQLQRNKINRTKGVSPGERKARGGPKKGMSPGERVARIGSTRNDARANKFISKQKEKEKAFEKKKKEDNKPPTGINRPGKNDNKKPTNINRPGRNDNRKITGVNRPGTDFGNIKKSSNIKNKITKLSTRILTSLPLLGPAAFATKLLYNEYLKQKAELRKDSKLRKKT